MWRKKYMLTRGIDDQNTKWLFASKGTHITYLNLNIQQH